jgi:predicted transcriptional regulator of viral defense system
MAATESHASIRPDFPGLYDVASGQQGLFTAKQAAAVGYSAQLLRHHVLTGRITRVLRGIYRLVHFPAGEHEDLVATWLWWGPEATFSHLTALALHELSDVLPHKIHLTVPECNRRRRVAIPAGVKVHHAEIRSDDRSWLGPVPVTTVYRTLIDCDRERISPDLLMQAVRQANQRGLLSPIEASTLSSHMATGLRES